MSPEHTAQEQGPEGALRAEAPDEHTRGKPGAPRGLRAVGRDAGAWGVASGEGARWGQSPCLGSTVPLPLKCTLNAVQSFGILNETRICLWIFID